MGDGFPVVGIRSCPGNRSYMDFSGHRIQAGHKTGETKGKMAKDDETK
jgi:hypothetical protein